MSQQPSGVRSSGRIAFGLLGLLCYPLWAMLVFATVKAVLVGWAFWQTLPAERDGELNVQPPIARWITWAHRVFEQLWSLLTMDPMVVGAARREAIQFMGGIYAFAVVLTAASLFVGVHVGRWVCRLAFKPGYWNHRNVRAERGSALTHCLMRGVLWAYGTVWVVSIITVVSTRTIRGGVSAPALPTLGWCLVLLGTPALGGVFAMIGAYRAAVRERIGPEEYLCDCDYECAPGKQCPECGAVTRALPAALRWRWQR